MRRWNVSSPYMFCNFLISSVMAAVKMEFKFKLDPDTCRRLITHSVLKCTEFTGNSKVPLDLKPKERDLNLRFARNHRNPPQRLVYKSLHFLNHTKTRQAQSQKAPSKVARAHTWIPFACWFQIWRARKHTWPLAACQYHKRNRKLHPGCSCRLPPPPSRSSSFRRPVKVKLVPVVGTSQLIGRCPLHPTSPTSPAPVP